MENDYSGERQVLRNTSNSELEVLKLRTEVKC